MTSQISSFFLSEPSTSRLKASKEIQHAGDFKSTHAEPVVDVDLDTEPGLDLDRLPGFELLRSRKKLRSFIWTYG
jgi:hypothetical protein